MDKAEREERRAIADAFEEARVERRWSYATVTKRVTMRLGEAAPTVETVRQYHRELPAKPDDTLVAVLAEIYGLTLEDLGRHLARRLEVLLGIASNLRDVKQPELPLDSLSGLLVEHTAA